MQKVLLTGLATAAFALGAPGVAHANHVVVVGGCSVVAVTDHDAGWGQMTGEIDIEAAVYSDYISGNPATAEIRCYITVNGSPQLGTDIIASGTGVVLGGGWISYWSPYITDDVQICQSVDGRDTECFELATSEAPPAITYEVVDPVACSVLPIVRGIPGLIETDPTGDLYVLGGQVYDCPPHYGTRVVPDSRIDSYRWGHRSRPLS